MKRLFLFLINPFAFSESKREKIFNSIEFYQMGIKSLATQVEKSKVQNTDFKFQPQLLKISNRYVLCKRCFARHLSALLGHKIWAGEIRERKVYGKYVLYTDCGKYFAFYDESTERVYMARKKHCGIYVQHLSRLNQTENFFHNY